MGRLGARSQLGPRGDAGGHCDRLIRIRYIVRDVGAAVDFSTTYLQFELQMHPNDLFAMLRRRDLRLVLVKPTGPQGPAEGGAPMPDGRMQEPGGWFRFSIEVPDLAAAVGELGSRRARFGDDVITETGGKQIIIEDPSGNPIELFQPILAEAS